jgi:hypothetical protein
VPRVGVVDRDRGYRRLVADLRDMHLKGMGVEVGIREEKGAIPYERDAFEVDGATVSTPGATLVQVAAVHEFGSRDGRIPERSWLRAPFDRHRKQYERVMLAGIGRVVDGALTLRDLLETVGAVVVGDLQENIAAGIAPANAPYTIARKGSSTPLIDTGRFRQSIDYGLTVKPMPRRRSKGQAKRKPRRAVP